MSDREPNRERDRNRDRAGQAAFYGTKLLGLRDDCNIPYCRHWESSTGWLLYDVGVRRWLIEFTCPEHGPSKAWRPEWQPLIEEVIASKVQEGFDIEGVLQALRDERKKEEAS